MILHWQYPKDASYFHDPSDFEPEKAGVWLEQDASALLHQRASSALAMLSNPKLPAFIKHEGGYICSHSLYRDIKRKHKNVTTFDALLKLTKYEPFYKFMRVKI